jgi:hypothetical protein
MKIFIVISVLIVGAFCAPMLENLLDSEWELFKRVHQKQYKTSDEESIRYVIREFWK